MYFEEENKCNCVGAENIFIDYIGKKVTVNLEFTKNNCNYDGILYGKVINNLGDPIKNALVKIMTVKYDSIFYTKTNSEGKYFFCNIPINKYYKILAIAKGYKLSEEIKFCIKKNTMLKINLVLKDELNDRLAIIVGDVFNKVNSLPINKVAVILYENISEYVVLKAVVYTNEFGQFAFTKLRLGSYTVKICVMGYITKSYIVNITKCGQITNIIVPLCPDSKKLKGTVSGVVTDQYNKPINESDVILYKVTSNNTLLPIDFTITNKQGVYLFINVEMGAYKIKANKKDWISTNVTCEGVKNE